jgi:hypothetical protein
LAGFLKGPNVIQLTEKPLEIYRRERALNRPIANGSKRGAIHPKCPDLINCRRSVASGAGWQIEVIRVLVGIQNKEIRRRITSTKTRYDLRVRAHPSQSE